MAPSPMRLAYIRFDAISLVAMDAATFRGLSRRRILSRYHAAADNTLPAGVDFVRAILLYAS